MNNYISVLTLLLRLRQACSHPMLVPGRDDKESLEVSIPNSANAGDPEDNLDELANALSNFGLSEISVCSVCQKGLKANSLQDGIKICLDCKEEIQRYSGLQFSTKIKKTLEILKKVRNEDSKRKTIIFSQFTQMFTILIPFLKASGFKFVTCKRDLLRIRLSTNPC